MQQWEMTEVFTFPSVLGNVLDGTSFKVEPNWQQEVKDESILLRGVYVVKGHVNFDFEPVEDAEKIEGISIEHLDVEKDKAYFEYAIPFSIDLPNDGDANVIMKVIDPQVSIMPGANCSCTWQVRCEVENKEVVVKETSTKVAKAEVNNVIEQQETKEIKEKVAVKEKIGNEPIASKEIKESKEIVASKEIKEPEEKVASKEIKEPEEKVVSKEIKEPKETIASKEIIAAKESIESKEIVEELEEIKTALAKSEFSTSEEVDFFDQLAEAYSVIKVHLNTKK